MNRYRLLCDLRGRRAFVVLAIAGVLFFFWWRRSGPEFVVPPFETAGPLPVIVVDYNEERIPNAMVVIHGFRAVQDPGSFYGWQQQEHGVLEAIATDEDGIARMTFPKWVDRKGGLLTSGFIVSVEHPDYCLQTNINCYLPQDGNVAVHPRVHLHKGGRLKIRAFREGCDVPLANFLATVSGDHNSDCWKSEGDARLSPVYASGPRVMRITDLTDPDVPQYSDPILFDASVGAVQERDVHLRPGIVLRGRLDAPKPVRNGRVVVKVLDLADGLSSTYDTSTVWADWTTVEEDGSFQFRSLPPTKSVSMMAVCDGSVSKLPELASVPLIHRSVEISRLPQFFDLDPNNAFCQIAMEPAAECRVTVTGPDGRPVEGVTVDFCPNVEHGVRASTYFCWTSHPANALPEIDSTYTDGVLASFRNAKDLHPSAGKTQWDYSGKTDADGKVHIKNLPGRGDEGLYISHDRWVVRGSSKPPFDRGLKVKLEPGKTAEFSVSLEPKPKLTAEMLAPPPTARPVSTFWQAIQSVLTRLGL